MPTHPFTLADLQARHRAREGRRTAAAEREAAVEATFAAMAAARGGDLRAAAEVHNLLLDLGSDRTLTRSAYVMYLAGLSEHLLPLARRDGCRGPHWTAYLQVRQVHDRLCGITGG
jgi:hypothetical protein